MNTRSVAWKQMERRQRKMVNIITELQTHRRRLRIAFCMLLVFAIIGWLT
jgi:superfamily I DNA and RNA helicase